MKRLLRLSLGWLLMLAGVLLLLDGALPARPRATALEIGELLFGAALALGGGILRRLAVRARQNPQPPWPG